MRGIKVTVWCAGVAALLAAGHVSAEATRTYFAGVPTNAAGIWLDGTMRIDQVMPGSPAEEAGVLAGDRVVGMNGRRVRNDLELGLVKSLMGDASGLRLHVLREGRVLALPVPRLEKGLLGVRFSSPLPTIDGVAFNSFGMRPTEYLGTRRGGRADGGALDRLLAEYTATNFHRFHPVLVQLAYFPARATERFHLLAKAKKPGSREWLLGLLKTYYALLESRPADAQRHLKEAKLLTTPMDPFLDGFADFLARIAAQPPDERGVDLRRYGVTPEYFALCFPPPVLPFRVYDWSPVSPALAADFARATEGLPWDPEERDQAARRHAAPGDQPVAERYLHYVHSVMVDCQKHGGWPMRFTPMFSPSGRADLLANLKANFATNAKDRVTCALALLAPSAVEGDTDTFRQALTVVRDAGSRELGVGNFICSEIWNFHDSPAQSAIEAIHREINESLGIPGVYKWLAAQNGSHADRLEYGWYGLNYFGLWDGTGRMRTADTVDALGGPAELMPAGR